MMVVIQIVLGLVILGVLVLVHELGHFTAAKSFGIRVLAFSIGFGKPLIKKTVGGTEYRLSVVPFGGYVRMSGENPEEKPDVEPGDFTAKPIWQRAIVAAAGPVANYAFAMLSLYVVFILGVNTPVYLMRPVVGGVDNGSIAKRAGFLPGDSVLSLNGKKVSSWEDVERELSFQQPHYDVALWRGGAVLGIGLDFPKVTTAGIPKESAGGLQPCMPAVIGAVNSGLAGNRAGLKAGDTVVSINGVPLHSWYELSSAIASYDTLSGPLAFTVRHGGKVSLVNVIPGYDKGVKRFLVGISAAPPETRKVRYGPVASVKKMFERTWNYTTMIFDVLGKLASKQVSPKQLAGPVGIVQMSGVVALSGIVPILEFMALIGINLAVLNLLPLLITDGGMLLFLCIEAVRRKPLPVKYQIIINRVAISFFIVLFVYVTFNDIARVPDMVRMFGK